MPIQGKKPKINKQTKTPIHEQQQQQQVFRTLLLQK